MLEAHRSRIDCHGGSTEYTLPMKISLEMERLKWSICATRKRARTGGEKEGHMCNHGLFIVQKTGNKSGDIIND